MILRGAILVALESLINTKYSILFSLIGWDREEERRKKD